MARCGRRREPSEAASPRAAHPARSAHGHGACGCAHAGRNRCAGIPGARGGVYIVAAAQPHGRRGRRATSAPLPTPHSRVACRALRPRSEASDAYSLHLTGTGDTSHRRDTAAGAVTPLTTSGDLAPELDLRWRYAIHTRTAESPKEIVRRPVHGRLACGAWAGGSA